MRTMKTLADLKRTLTVGTRLQLKERYGRPVNKKRTIVQIQSNGVWLKSDEPDEFDGHGRSFLDYPKATLQEFDGETIRIFDAGERELTDAEREIIADEPRDEKQLELDMMTDTNIMFWRRKGYYKDAGMEYLQKSRNGRIRDNKVKGTTILWYEIEAC